MDKEQTKDSDGPCGEYSVDRYDNDGRAAADMSHISCTPSSHCPVAINTNKFSTYLQQYHKYSASQDLSAMSFSFSFTENI